MTMLPSLGGRCLVIAEAGVNHNGQVELAHRLVDVAADAGADAVKFQTFDPALVAARDAGKADYQRRTTDAGESQLDMLRRLQLPEDAYGQLVDHASERGILFLSTPFDEPSAEFLQRLGVPALKVASGELTNHRFLRFLSRTGLPLMLSTGMADADEVRAAVDVVRTAGGRLAALFHCVSDYPAAAEDSNLRAMETLRAAHGVPVGWSDHTLGIEVSIAAAALGAELIEKHFTLSRDLDGPDHAASLEPDELSDLVRGVRVAAVARGDGVKQPAAAERSVAAVARRSLHAACDLEGGRLLTADDLVALRPGTGISPAEEETVVGRRLVRPVASGTLLRREWLT